LTSIPALIAWQLQDDVIHHSIILIIGLIFFGIIFAINSSVHSFLILKYANNEGVSLDVGFYYMANAWGRLIGTLLSGIIFQWQGLEACLILSSLFLFIATIFSFILSLHQE
jgi:predicted MFS family arabinose efflux permease